MTPHTRRQWERFQQNRRGYWSLWIFLALFIISLGADLIANDRPLLLHYEGHWYLPVFKTYSETDFGGDFETEADYRDPYLRQKIENSGGWMLWPLIHYNYSTINYDLTVPAPSPPDHENWLGTDDQGRDLLARLIYGFRISILFGLTLTFFSSVIGIISGAIQGYYGGNIDLLFQRIIEVWSAVPTLFLLIILASIVTPNFWWLLAIQLLFSWMSLVDVVRAEFLRARNLDYIRAARALGVSEWNTIIRHILPNAFISALTIIPFTITGAIISLTTLDFLGFGLPPGSASLGEILLQGKINPQASWLGITGFITLATLLVLLTFIGEAVRDALNPRKTLGK